MTSPTREAWLMDGLKKLRPLFKEIGQRIPDKIRVSCGFPSSKAFSNKGRRIGECWADKASAGNYFEIFISPVLNKPVKVLDVLAHEVVHSVVGIEAGHKGPFIKVARAVGLIGKPTATEAGPELLRELRAIASGLGAYPHDEMNKMVTLKKAKDTCRLLKAECPSCGYIIRVTKKWIEAGMPTCVCGTDFEEA